jgi:hypothetical protein
MEREIVKNKLKNTKNGLTINVVYLSSDITYELDYDLERNSELK